MSGKFRAAALFVVKGAILALVVATVALAFVAWLEDHGMLHRM
jgi:hypothetical protein